MGKTWERLYREQRGITGLETAIILIAFVVVASVFAYVVLSAGFLAADQAKGTIIDGLKKTSATLELRGSVIAIESATPDKVGTVEFLVSPAIPGTSIDVTTSNTVISYWDIFQKKNSLVWTRTFLYDADSDNVLDGGDLLKITIANLATALNANLLDPLLGTNTDLVIEVKPPQGGVLVISRTTPPSIDTVNDLN